MARPISTLMPFQYSSEAGRFPIQPSLLKGVDRIPDESLNPLDVGFPFCDGGIMPRPLTNDRPRGTILVQERDEVLLSWT